MPVVWASRGPIAVSNESFREGLDNAGRPLGWRAENQLGLQTFPGFFALALQALQSRLKHSRASIAFRKAFHCCPLDEG